MRNKMFLSIIFLGYLMTIDVFGQGENPANQYIDAYKQYLGATCPIEADSVKHFVYFARDREQIQNHSFLKIKRIVGAQIMYFWEQNIVPLLHAFAKEFLKVKYMFWVNQEPYFSEYVIPCLSND